MPHYVLKSIPIWMINYTVTLVIMCWPVSLVLFHLHRLCSYLKPNEPFINVLVFVVPRERICMFVSFNTFIIVSKRFYQWWVSNGILRKKNDIVFICKFSCSPVGHMIRVMRLWRNKYTKFMHPIKYSLYPGSFLLRLYLYFQNFIVPYNILIAIFIMLAHISYF